ncbi:MAG: hypothetical protein C5B58_05650 [Acidobacteria bacterium]|nr:MAG: hypothetical protein C5B58_05650 [Acidobacteriota bacterium]
MAARLALFLYRAACVVAVLWIGFVLLVTARLPVPDWTIATPVAGAGALIVWTIGWAFRYILTGR